MSEFYANVARFLPQKALKMPDFCAVKVPYRREGEAIFYKTQDFKELDDSSSSIAYFLQSRGVIRGARVLLMVKPGLDLIEITFALFKMGAVPIIIDPGMGLKQFLRCVRTSRPDVLLGIPLTWSLSWVLLPYLRGLKTRICVGTSSWRRKVKSFKKAGIFPVAKTREDELAAILFTSGSTGAPKGVCYEHGMFEAQVRLLKDQYAIQPGEVDLPMLPLFALFNPALGMVTVVPEMNPSRPASVDPHKIVQAIQQCGVTNSFGSPTLWAKIGRYCNNSGIILPSLRRVFIAGAPVTPSLMELLSKCFPNAALHSPYGATEALPLTTIDSATILKETRNLTEAGAGTCVGYPFPEIELKIISISDEALEQWEMVEECPAGQIGEIVVRGPVVTKQYDKLPEATRQAKIKQGNSQWHRMGDVGYLDEKGRLWFCGRKIERVQTKQETFFTEPIEAIFNQHPKISRSALISVDQRGVISPAVVVQPEVEEWPKNLKAQQVLYKELQNWAMQHPKTKAIQQFFFAKQFPVDVRHNAKIHRLRLAKLVASTMNLR